MPIQEHVFIISDNAKRAKDAGISILPIIAGRKTCACMMPNRTRILKYQIELERLKLQRAKLLMNKLLPSNEPS